jgi:Tfp pilus assembly protein PilV
MAGFTLLESLFAIGILTIGMVSMAALVAGALSGTGRSRYMGLATTLASEKLEDLNRWPESDPNVAVPTGSATAGSLTSDLTQNVTIGAISESVNYFDEVILSSASGAISETHTSLDAGGNLQYTTTSHAADGKITVSSPSSTAPSTAGTISFKRRWIIEKDQPSTGVNRITVRVTAINQSMNPPVSFQISMVRP